MCDNPNADLPPSHPPPPPRRDPTRCLVLAPRMSKRAARACGLMRRPNKVVPDQGRGRWNGGSGAGRVEASVCWMRAKRGDSSAPPLEPPPHRQHHSEQTALRPSLWPGRADSARIRVFGMARRNQASAIKRVPSSSGGRLGAGGVCPPRCTEPLKPWSWKPLSSAHPSPISTLKWSDPQRTRNLGSGATEPHLARPCLVKASAWRGRSSAAWPSGASDSVRVGLFRVHAATELAI